MLRLLDTVKSRVRAWRPDQRVYPLAAISLLVLICLLVQLVRYPSRGLFVFVSLYETLNSNRGVVASVLVLVLAFLAVEHGIRRYQEMTQKVAELAAENQERQRVEHALKESEERWRSMVENAPNFITVVDQEHAILFINHTVPGLEQEEVIGRSIYDYIDAEYHDVARQEFDRVFITGEPGFYRSLATGPHGSLAWYDSFVGPVKQDDMVVALTLISSDVTERLQIEQALNRRMQQLTALSRASQIVTASLELDQVLAEIVSLTSEVTASEYTSIVLMDASAQTYQSIDSLPNIPAVEHRIRSEGLTRWLVRSRCPVIIDDILPDGTIVPDLGQGAPRYANPHAVDMGVKSVAGLPLIVREKLLGVVLLHNLQPRAFQGQMPMLQAFANQAAIAIENARLYQAAQQEIEERARAEEALQYQAFLLENVSDAIVSGDPDFRIQNWNRASKEIYGWTAKEVVGKLFPEIVRPDYSPMRRADVLKEFVLNGYWQGVAIHHRKDGTPFHVSVQATRLKDNHGSPSGSGSANRDISEQVQAERALKESHLNLEQTLNELKETQEKLVQQERLAAVGQLAAGIAHDFNNVMASIILFSDLMLANSPLSPGDRDKLQSIKKQGQHAADLTQQILDFSRKAVLQKRPVELNAFLGGMENLLGRTLPENIRLYFELWPGELRVSADQTRLQQAIMNLAINARDAMLSKGGGKLWIELDCIESDGGSAAPLPEMGPGEWARISVRDEGTGIPAEIVPRIFEPFFTTRAPLGSGLGLAQVYGIVTQHQGFIDVQSTVGAGSTFTIFLPILAEVELESLVQAGAGLVTGQGELILVVEDEPAVRDALAQSLLTLNYQPLLASNGQQALELYEHAQDDIAMVLSDLVMPEMGGMALARQLKDRYPAMQMVVITGYGDKADSVDDIASLGVVGWIQKPIDLGQLAEIVARHLTPK